MTDLVDLNVAPVRNAAAALLFMQSGTMAMDVYSATNSSPWTAESFGGDPAKETALWGYVRHAMVISALYGGGAAIISTDGLWVYPVVGTLLGNGYMWWLYKRAVDRSKTAGSKGWSDGGGARATKPSTGLGAAA